MEDKKVIQNEAEQALMSLAHEILRHRNRMSLDDIQQKAAAIIALTSPPEKGIKDEKVEDENIEEKTPLTKLEEALQKPIKEAEFEVVTNPFLETLFEGNKTDFQRVMSMLKSKESLEKATSFIKEQIQPDYDWSTKEKEVAAFLNHIANLYPA